LKKIPKGESKFEDMSDSMYTRFGIQNVEYFAMDNVEMISELDALSSFVLWEKKFKINFKRILRSNEIV
jgi:hypothetical protein